MKIEYLGHSSFYITDGEGVTLVTDPYDDATGYFFPDVKADEVSVSHYHYDHCNVDAVKGKPRVFDPKSGIRGSRFIVKEIQSYHDGQGGRLRGSNLIFKYLIDGVNVCHMGDTGEECTGAIAASLMPVDVLLIPVGGKYTIDAAQAKRYVDMIKPTVVIPMHYSEKGCTLGTAGVDKFLGLFGGDTPVERGALSVSLTQADLDGKTKIIVMESRTK